MLGAPHSWLLSGMGWSYSVWDDYSVTGLFCLAVEDDRKETAEEKE